MNAFFMEVARNLFSKKKEESKEIQYIQKNCIVCHLKKYFFVCLGENQIASK